MRRMSLVTVLLCCSLAVIFGQGQAPTTVFKVENTTGNVQFWKIAETPVSTAKHELFLEYDMLTLARSVEKLDRMTDLLHDHWFKALAKDKSSSTLRHQG